MDSTCEYNERPWGHFTVLDAACGYQVKRIEVFPGHRLSYQRHAQRSEQWIIVEGRARVIVDGREVQLDVGETLEIGIGSAHRVGNDGARKLVFIEIQRGQYLGEDDIERLEDDYGRV